MSIVAGILVLDKIDLEPEFYFKFERQKMKVQDIELKHFKKSFKQFIRVIPFILLKINGTYKILKSTDEFIPTGFIESCRWFERHNIFNCMIMWKIPEPFMSIINKEGKTAVEESESRKSVEELFEFLDL